MCGFFGLLDYHHSRKDLSFLRNVDKLLYHRGPDGGGVFLSSFNKNKLIKNSSIEISSFPAKFIALHRRLAIIDLQGGFQPMSNEDKSIWVITNGEIYNFKELRSDLKLKGHKFKTFSDSEVILHLYEEYGSSCVKYLRGMFAFAIWDEQNRRLFISRDRLGIKPLYYYSNGSTFGFASELKALLCLQPGKFQIDEKAIDEYITLGYIPHPRSIFKKIKKLDPGSFIEIDENGFNISKYWKSEFDNNKLLDGRDIVHELKYKLSEAVSMRMISDVPLGAFLSGGLDSSTIVALMCRNSRDRIKTFSIGFKEKEYDETSFANIVAREYGTQHHSLIVEPGDLDVISKIIRQFDEPFGDSSAIPTYFVSKMAREHVTVCLSGDGGDEIFGGYKSYSRSLMYRYWDLIPLLVRKKLIGSLYEKWPENKSGKGLLERILAERNDRFWLMNSLTTELEKRKLYRSSFYRRIIKINNLDDPLNMKFFEDDKDYLSQMQLFDIQYYLPADILTKVDKMSMLNSLEVRVPLLDHHVVEFMGQIPSALKAKNRNTKILLKKMAKDLLPDNIINRRKKGFSVPLKYWFKGHLDEYIKNILLDPNCFIWDYFEKSAINDVLIKNKTGSRDFGYMIWRLLMLELWFREYNDKII